MPLVQEEDCLVCLFVGQLYFYVPKSFRRALYEVTLVSCLVLPYLKPESKMFFASDGSGQKGEAHAAAKGSVSSDLLVICRAERSQLGGAPQT